MIADLQNDELVAEVMRLTLLCQQGEAGEDERNRLDILLADSEKARLIYLYAANDTVTLVDTSDSIDLTEPQSIGEMNNDLASLLPNSAAGIVSADENLTAVEFVKSRPLFFAAASIALIFTIAFAVRNSKTPNKSTPETKVAANSNAKTSESKAAPIGRLAVTPTAETDSSAFSGRLINLANVEWPDGARRYQPWQKISVGEAIRFDAGVVELMLENGAQILLQGPADFRLVSPRKAIARRGKLVMRCGPDAVGFEVESPDARIVDLGTVFGLSIVDGTSTDVVVYEGAVDLSVRASTGAERRLTAGEALHIARNGEIGRITAVQTGTFLPPPNLLSRGDGRSRLIGSVSDSLLSEETSKYYRVVGGGFTEDCRAFVDRLHEWNGLDSQGMPRFLRGGDYVMTFNDDKLRDVRIALELLRPAKVYVLMDDRVSPPKWLTTDFVDTGWDLGLDAHIVTDDKSRFRPSQLTAEIGPGRSVDSVFSIWVQEVSEATVIELGSLRGNDLGDIDPYSVKQSMYGVVVTPLRSHRTNR
ncbi:MAG: hypothetical protein ACR2NM_16485 [Bythopirellula sp.]